MKPVHATKLPSRQPRIGPIRNPNSAAAAWRDHPGDDAKEVVATDAALATEMTPGAEVLSGLHWQGV